MKVREQCNVCVIYSKLHMLGFSLWRNRLGTQRNCGRTRTLCTIYANNLHFSSLDERFHILECLWIYADSLRTCIGRTTCNVTIMQTTTSFTNWMKASKKWKRDRVLFSQGEHCIHGSPGLPAFSHLTRDTMAEELPYVPLVNFPKILLWQEKHLTSHPL